MPRYTNLNKNITITLLESLEGSLFQFVLRKKTHITFTVIFFTGIIDGHCLFVNREQTWPFLNKSCICQAKPHFCFPELPVEILKPLRNTTVTEGDKLILEVELSKPDYPVTWKRDGITFKPSDTSRLTVDGCIHRLEIDAVELEDEANYSLHAGEKSCKALVLIEGKVLPECMLRHSTRVNES